MEANTKQQQLLFDKGITNVPSDNLCSDNTLAESVGMVYDNGEHRVIQKPKEFITSAVSAQSGNVQITGIPAILYVHKFNDETRYIANATLTDSGHPTPYTGIVWGTVASKVFTLQGGLSKDNQLITYENGMKITSVGKTLVISKSDGMDYFLWKNGIYDSLGEMPEQKVDFWLWNMNKPEGRSGGNRSGLYVMNSASSEGILEEEGGVIQIAEYQQETYNDLVVGLYAKNKKAIANNKGFCEPFFIRTAIELYDGSYTHISQPILMLPSITENLVFGGDAGGIFCTTYYLLLKYKDESNFAGWEDVIKGVSVFISDGVSLYDPSVDQSVTMISSAGETIYNGIYRADPHTMTPDRSAYSLFHETKSTTGFRGIKRRDLAEIFNDIKSVSVFYKLCDLGLNVTGIGSEKWLGEKFDAHTLELITSQEVLEYDDYYSRCKLTAGYIYSYNSRLNLGNVSRGFFEGFDNFMPNDDYTSSHTYDFYVTIVCDDGNNRIVHHQVSGTYQKQGIYFYYPDSRARHVRIIKDGTTCVLDAALTEHSGLNGASFFYPASLESYTNITIESLFEEKTVTASAPTVNMTPEPLPNYIIQSEVNNPWVFQAQGYFAVGTGKIVGMSSITQALSEGQFGSYPLLVFSESGVWALSVASTGYYSSIHPMSREVCNNADSITQTDGAVFFTSEKGLMVVVGSQVKCVSEQLSGMNDDYAVKMYGVTDPLFPNSSLGNVTNYFRNCMMAYDYRDSLLWIFSRLSATYCYIYSIKSGTFSKYRLASPVQRCVNDYPDYLLQGLDGNVLSLLNRSNINYDTHTATVDGQTVTLKNQYSATMLTRPLKLENALALKSIMHVKHIKQFSSYEISGVPLKGYLTFRIFASNNLENWVEIGSLRGVPWKYYRFRYDFVNLIATDRFAGTVLVTQERRTDKLR